MTRSAPTHRRARRRGALVAGGAALAIAGGLLVTPLGLTPALSAPTDFSENFDGVGGPEQAPAGWSIDRQNTAGMQPDWQGWSFHTAAEIVAKWDATGDRDSFTKGSGLVAVVQSDKNRPTTGTFSSTLWSPEVPLGADAQAAELSFDSHYKQGKPPQNARLVARFDGGTPQTVQDFQTKRLDAREKFSVDVPAGAKRVQFGWSYLEGANNWFWMIDNVHIAEAVLPDVTPKLANAAKPVATAGGTTSIALSGLRPGQRLNATIGTGGGAQQIAVPEATADGRASFELKIDAKQAPGVVPVTVDGPGAKPLTFGVTVLAAGQPAYTSTEQQLWHSGFEGANAQTWTTAGTTAWEFLDRSASLERYGTDRRHAFTRASGTMAVAEAGLANFDGKLTSPKVPVTGAAGEALELRLDSHLLKRGTGTPKATITAAFDTGVRTELIAIGTEDRESEQLRLPLTVPAGAKSVTVEFAFAAPAGAGSWRVDDVELVRPLAPLAEAAKPSAVVDVFSDVQGSTQRLQNQVLPGLRGLAPQAKTLVSNGDLTANGTELQYTSYFRAYDAGAGDQYLTKLSTIGNHEFYGSDGSEAYIKRFLDRTGMRGHGPEGADPAHNGIWGETLVDGELPVLWIGSEFHDYPSHTGSGPFVEMSDQQFTWLQGRLAHWREQNTPVVLFSHHVFNDSVSGTYAKFYQGDFESDTARIEALLAQNPNVTVLTSHTHWGALLNDWSVEQRFDPAAKHGPTIVNTVAVTTQYGPDGDWAEKPLGGSDPVGLRVGLFDDRLRVTAYGFGPGGAAKELKHIDVPRPTRGTETPNPTPKIALGASTVLQGGKVSVSGSGFEPGEQLSLELIAGKPVASARTAVATRAGGQETVTADAEGAFSASVGVPANTPVGQHTVEVRRADGSAITQPIEVRAASEGPGTGPLSPGKPGTGSGTDPKPDSGTKVTPGSGNTAAGADRGAKSGLARTGGEGLLIPGALAALVAIAGGTLLARRRRS